MYGIPNVTSSTSRYNAYQDLANGLPSRRNGTQAYQAPGVNPYYLQPQDPPAKKMGLVKKLLLCGAAFFLLAKLPKWVGGKAVSDVLSDIPGLNHVSSLFNNLIGKLTELLPEKLTSILPKKQGLNAVA